jgi:hypothetical protein
MVPGSSQDEPVGSFALVDSYFQNIATIIKTYLKTSSRQPGSTVISVNNVGFENCGKFILLPNNQVVSLPGGVSSNKIGYLQLGDTATHNDTEYGWFTADVPRPSVLTERTWQDLYPQERYINSPYVPCFTIRSCLSLTNSGDQTIFFTWTVTS